MASPVNRFHKAVQCRSIDPLKKSVLSRPSPHTRRLDTATGSNESNQVFYGPLPHLLVESAHGMELEVRRVAVRRQSLRVRILLIDDRRTRFIL
jgi:hypothetical protein